MQSLSELKTFGLECTVPGASLAVSIEQARRNSFIDTSEHDERLTQHIRAATEWLQTQTETALITSTWRWTIDRFPRKDRALLLPRWPVQQIVSITYRDANNATQLIDAQTLRLRKNTGRSRVALADWYPWPATRVTPDAVEITFTAGFGDSPIDVPAQWQQLILLLVGHWFENSEAAVVGTTSSEIPFGVMSLLDSLRDPDDYDDFDLD